MGLLIAGASAFGQADSGPGLILPKPKANLYLEVGPSYMNTKIGDQYYDKTGIGMFGISTALGWRINKSNKIQLEIGVHGSSKKNDATYTAVPVLVSYNYCIPLGKSNRCELRLSPAAGFNVMGAKYDHYIIRRWYNGHEYIDGNDAAVAPAYGAGIGLTCHPSPRFLLDFGYRFTGIGSVDLKYTEIKAQTAHAITARIGWKF
jgi:opacity protein-like surface antigen